MHMYDRNFGPLSVAAISIGVRMPRSTIAGNNIFCNSAFSYFYFRSPFPVVLLTHFLATLEVRKFL